MSKPVPPYEKNKPDTYLFITTLLVNQPAFPSVPSVATANGEQTIEDLLPFRGRRKDRALTPTIGIFQVLQRRTV